MKKFLIISGIALLLGGYFAYIMFDGTVNADSYKDENGFVRAKAFQVGVFSRVENANRVAKLNNGIVVQEDDMYRVYIGVLSKDAAINNLKKFYDLYDINYYIRDIYVNEFFLESVNELENSIIKCNTECTDIMVSLLNKYEEYK